MRAYSWAYSGARPTVAWMKLGMGGGCERELASLVGTERGSQGVNSEIPRLEATNCEGPLVILLFHHSQSLLSPAASSSSHFKSSVLLLPFLLCRFQSSCTSTPPSCRSAHGLRAPRGPSCGMLPLSYFSPPHFQHQRSHKICSFGLKMFTASGIVTRRAAELPILFRVCSLLRFKPKIARVHGAKMEAPERMVLECNFSWSVLSEEAGSEREWACERPYAFCPPPECK